jgi:hypothetical protein
MVQIPELHGQTFIEIETITKPDGVPGALEVVCGVLAGLDITEIDLSMQSYTERVVAKRHIKK